MTDPSLTFIPWRLPALRSGQYEIAVEQAVQVGKGSTETFSASQAFVVAGARYRLDPTQINSLSPRNGARGEFSRQLPHVVLNAPTLPWQRSPHPQPPETQDDGPRASWLAVLLFDESDPPPPPQQLTLAQLKSAGASFCPERSKEPGEQDSDPVTVIDVDVALFNAIAPTLADLDWNAHVRRVDPQAKVNQSDAPAQLDYAVVVGNRLPAVGHSAVAHLVSLENHATWLPDANGQPGKDMPGQGFVRLVSLANWTFSSRDAGQGFSRMLEGLNRNPAALQMPWKASDAAPADSDARVRNAFGLGYTAMPHQLRNGEQSVSWYRGPLLPVAGQAKPASACDHPDQLLRYDPANGMFDVSYSAAWQLGRLLALSNGSFASTLYRWKLGHTQQQLQAWEKDHLDQALGELSAPMLPIAGGSQVGRVLASLVPQAVKGLEESIRSGND